MRMNSELEAPTAELALQPTREVLHDALAIFQLVVQTIMLVIWYNVGLSACTVKEELDY